MQIEQFSLGKPAQRGLSLGLSGEAHGSPGDPGGPPGDGFDEEDHLPIAEVGTQPLADVDQVLVIKPRRHLADPAHLGHPPLPYKSAMLSRPPSS